MQEEMGTILCDMSSMILWLNDWYVLYLMCVFISYEYFVTVGQ